MHIHDSGYKKLFSNRTMFRQLLETFVHEPWVQELDFDHCETLDKTFISDHYKETESDLIYKIRFRGREAYLFILLEFQSTVDRFMVLRVLNYLSNFYMDYVASQKRVRYLPVVFPIVLYNGEERWTAPISFAELFKAPESLGTYLPQFTYFKLVEHEYSQEELLRVRNLVSTLFLAETHYDYQLIQQELLAVFQYEEDRQAISLLLNWFRQLKEHGRLEPTHYEEFERLYQNAEEVKSMLIKALEREREQLRKELRPEVRTEVWAEVRAELLPEVKAEVRKEVHAEVRAQGLIEGLLKAIEILLKSTFGSDGSDMLTHIAQIHDVATLQHILERIPGERELSRLQEFVMAQARSSKN